MKTSFVLNTKKPRRACLLTMIRKGLEEIVDGSVRLPATATLPGPDGNTAENTVSIITNPKSGILTVTNITSFDGGRDTETDAEFRARYYRSVDLAGGVNIDAIIAEIYESVEAIISVTGEENDTDEVNAHGLPPHSFEIIAYGGLEEDIAKAIYRRKAAGIQTFVNTTVAVAVASGPICDISFSRPNLIKIWVRVYSLVTNADFPSDGAAQIKQHIMAFIGGDSRSGLNIGEPVIRMMLPTQVFKVSGVVDFKLKISADGQHYGWDNISIAAREKAVTDESSVEVS